MYKNIEDKKAYGRKYYHEHKEDNKEKIRIRNKKYRDNNREKILKRNRKYREDNPWIKTLCSVNKRAQGKEAKERYFDNGIKSKLTLREVKYLWLRDKAYDMEKPTLHRRDNNGNYDITNCEYLEFSNHSRLHRLEEKEKNQ